MRQSDRIKKQESQTHAGQIKTHETLPIFLLKKPPLSCTDEQQLLGQRFSGNICSDVHAISDQILHADVWTASDRLFCDGSWRMMRLDYSWGMQTLTLTPSTGWVMPLGGERGGGRGGLGGRDSTSTCYNIHLGRRPYLQPGCECTHD